MIRIYGASDDLVCLEGDVTEEVSEKDVISIGDATRGVRITFRYAASSAYGGGVWQGAVEPWDEGIPMFAVTVGAAERGYSTLLTVDCPKGTPVTVNDAPLGKRKCDECGGTGWCDR